MRKMQLSFKIESFGELAKNGNHQIVEGYIDANSVCEVLKEEIEGLREIYAKDVPYDEFYRQIMNFDGQRFGQTEVNSKDC